MAVQAKKIKAKATGEVVFIVETTEELCWEVVKETDFVELTNKEALLATAKGLDSAKFLQVKQLLIKGLSYSKINKKTGIAKTTISRYRKDYCQSTLNLILEATKKLSKNYSKTYKNP